MELSEFISLPQVPAVILMRPQHPPEQGTLLITGHHMILASRDENRTEIWIMHRNIDLVERKQSGRDILLYCKDFQIIQLKFAKSDECQKAAQSIVQLSNISDVSLWYPFIYQCKFDILEDGWLAFAPSSELAKYQSSNEWRISNINRDYRICKSYPDLVVVPRSVDDEVLEKSAGFRMNERFPVLCFYHKTSGAALIRSGQPMVGMSNKRCKEDEMLLNSYVVSGKKAYIVDTRKPSAAKSAAQKGGGYESETTYSLWKRVHHPVEKWGGLQDSLSTLIEALTDTSLSIDKFLNRLNTSHWLDFVRDILITSCVVAQYLHKEGATVLVHGYGGMDTTLQVTSIAQIILDPDCRTIRGFEALIEREWIQAGHPFRDRCNNSAYSRSTQKTESPVFLIFLDAVWQIWQQFPCSFEFNESFLETIFLNCYASKYGTFLANSYGEGKRLQLNKKTISLWSYINRPEFLQTYMNPLYEPNSNIIWPSVAPQSLCLWQGLYMKHQIDQNQQVEIWDSIKQVKDKNVHLQQKAARLRRQIDALSKELQEEGISTSDALVRNGSFD